MISVPMAQAPAPLHQKREKQPSPGRRRTLSAKSVLELLEPEYGPFVWQARYDPISEVVATILSQHTSDTNSERAFTRLLEHFGSLEAIAEGDVEEIGQCVSVAGLARIKAPRIKEVLQGIQRQAGSLDLSLLKEMPLEEAKAWLMALPGIGPKSAAVILCFSLGMPAMPVDTHVHRVARRLGLIGEKTTADQAHPILEAMLAPERVYAFHVALITHGRRVCNARRPLCERCVLSFGCPSSRV